MISICIPVYNHDIRDLAFQLGEQAGRADFPVEILIYDDCSGDKFRELNRRTALNDKVRYVEMEENKGRSAIRNILGKNAAYPWLLFIDSDSLADSRNFLSKYKDATTEGTVICGGTKYHDTPPSDPNCLLRWVYGKKREQKPASLRNSGNKYAITSNNFMISKEIFLQCPFRETIRGYGHEDTVLGIDLVRNGHKIVHIDNPVLHEGLETSAEYLEKSKAALDNLLHIAGHILTDVRFQEEIRLLKLRNQLRKTGLLGAAGWCFRTFESLLRKNLTGKHPSLFLFDLYRTGYLCQRE